MTPTAGISIAVRAKVGGECKAVTAKKIEKACHVFYPAIVSVSLAVREHKASLQAVEAALKAVQDAIKAATLSVGPLHVHYEMLEPSRGLRTYTLSSVVEAQLGALKSVSDKRIASALKDVRNEKNAITGSGRPRRAAAKGLARAILSILSDGGVPPRKHRRVVHLCFDLMGLTEQAEAAYRAAKKEVDKTLPA